jgi:hypothetical protein
MEGPYKEVTIVLEAPDLLAIVCRVCILAVKPDCPLCGSEEADAIVEVGEQ